MTLWVLDERGCIPEQARDVIISPISNCFEDTTLQRGDCLNELWQKISNEGERVSV